MEGTSYLCLVEVGQNCELTQPDRGGTTQLQSTKNPTFDHLEGTGSELKSDLSKISILGFLCGRRDWRLLTNQLLEGPWQRTLLHHVAHSTKESLG
jgi:hypothetical protein